jgi:transcriptional regulator PpsR
MTLFSSPESTLAGLPVPVLGQAAALAADLCLVVGADGVIRDVAVTLEELPPDLAGRWIGLRVQAIVPDDEQHKLADLLAGADRPSARRWRQLNLAVGAGESHLIQCVAMRLHDDGRLLVVGRSLQGTARLQQRLVQAQQAMEQDYGQLRDAETRYRQLFQASSEGVLVLDADTLRVAEANPAAGRLLARDGSDLNGCPLPDLLGAGADEARLLLARVRASGRPAEGPVALHPGAPGVLLSATAYRQAGSAHLLVRLTPLGQAQPPTADGRGVDWSDLARAAPDALVLADGDGRVLAANGSFLELAQLGAEEQLRGESLERWFDRGSVDLSVLLSNLRQRGVVRLYATRLRGELGSSVEVEVAAVRVSASPAVLGFVIRDVSRRLSTSPRALGELPQSVAQLTELVGRVPMKEIVGETAELIEQLCIDAALELTRGNRASAAEMLGISRQSLYVKLRRQGQGVAGVENEK